MSGNSTIEKVVIGRKVQKLDEALFKDYTALHTIDFTNARNTVELTKGCFDNCRKLARINNYSHCLSAVEDQTFRNCVVLSTLPQNTLAYVGDEAFLSCKSLNNIHLSDQIEYVGLSAFYGCKNFNKDGLKIDSTNIRDYAFTDTTFKSVNMTQGYDFECVGREVFANNTKLTDVELDGRCHLGTQMFKDCKSLSTVKFDCTTDGFMHDEVFSGCESLISVVIPKYAQVLSEGLFTNCSSLTTIQFEPQSILGCVCDRAFSGCVNLQSITLPNSITSIWQLMDHCFENTNLTSITLEGFEEFTEDQKSRVNETAMFGLKKDCLIIFSTGEEYEYIYDNTIVKPCLDASIDKMKAANFKTGIWYANVVELEKFAEAKRAPVLIIGGKMETAGYEFFKKYIWQNKSFQDWAAAQKIYLGIALADCQIRYTPEAGEFLYQSAKDAANVNSTATNAMGESFNDITLEKNENSPILKLAFKLNDISYIYSLSYIDSLVRNTEIGPDETAEFIKRLCKNDFDSNLSTGTNVTDVSVLFDRGDFNPYYVTFSYEYKGLKFSETQHCKSSKTYTAPECPLIEDGKMTLGWKTTEGNIISGNYQFADIARDSHLFAVPNTYTYEFDESTATMFVLDVGTEPVYVTGELIPESQAVIDYDYVDESQIIVRSNKSQLTISGVKAIDGSQIVIDWDYDIER